MHFTHESVVSYMNESIHARLSGVTRECIIAHIVLNSTFRDTCTYHLTPTRLSVCVCVRERERGGKLNSDSYHTHPHHLTPIRLSVVCVSEREREIEIAREREIEMS